MRSGHQVVIKIADLILLTSVLYVCYKKYMYVQYIDGIHHATCAYTDTKISMSPSLDLDDVIVVAHIHVYNVYSSLYLLLESALVDT